MPRPPKAASVSGAVTTRKPKTQKGKAASAEARPIHTYRHRDKDRIHLPSAGLVNAQADPVEVPKKVYAYDPHQDPSLAWAGKAERAEVEVPVVSLHVHERIDPHTILEAVKRAPQEGESYQPSMFEDPRERLSLAKALAFYQHRRGWTNRLIAGDSLAVMNSLLEKENLRGQVQIVFMDPPYGIAFGSNFQPFVNKREVTDGRDEDLNQEPEMLRAFRDTWELGIHSYLTYLRDRLRLAKDLLHESGSVFVQINDRNLHLVRSLMDEVFGSDHYIVSIPFKKKGSQNSGYLDPVNDYLVWYGASPRESGKLKFRSLFVKRELDIETLKEFKTVELSDGRQIPLSELRGPSGEKRNYLHYSDLLFEDYPEARLFRANPLVSPHERPNMSVPYKYEGKAYSPGPNRCWKTTARTDDGSPCGMDRLTWAGRLIPNPDSLRFKSYYDDFGYYPLTNWWDGLGGASKPIYVVQTNLEVIQRCMLMVTDPGDLVLDPTCGSGSTAVVAEEWGRRWITCDSSRVALTLAKQRLMTQVFDYYRLARPQEGVGSGFEYETAAHLMLSDIANCPEVKPGMDKALLKKVLDRYAKQEVLVDRPKRDRDKVRVTGPFTVEAVPSPVVKSLTAEDPAWDDQALARSGETLRQSDWRRELLAGGIRGKKGQRIRFGRVEPLPGYRYLHADAETVPDASGSDRVGEAAPALEPVRALLSFGPEGGPLDQRQVELAVEEGNKLFASVRPKPMMLVFCAFQFDPEAAKDIDEFPADLLGYPVLKVQMATDLLTEDLKKGGRANDAFWLLGQPDVNLWKNPDGTHQVSVQGFDYFNTKTGALEGGGQDRVALWLLDTDYDGRSLFPRQVFFPMAGKQEGWHRLAKDLKVELDHAKLDAYRGTESLAFTAGAHRRIAVKIVDDRGLESLKVMDLA